MWGDSDPDETVALWAHKLDGIDRDDLRGAMGALETTHPAYPPTLFEFLGLVRDQKHRRVQTVQRLAAPRPSAPDPAVLRHVAEVIQAPKRDPLKWARDIIVQSESGHRFPTPLSVRYAREVLGIGEAA